MAHEIANFAFKAQSLFLGGFSELFLQCVFLSTVAFFFACVVAFAMCHSSAFSRFVQGHCMNLMLLTFRAVRCDFFRNVHVIHYQLSINKTCAFLYLFALFSGLVAAAGFEKRFSLFLLFRQRLATFNNFFGFGFSGLVASASDCVV